MNPIPLANARKIISKYGLKYPLQYKLEEILNAEKLYLCEKKLDGLDGTIVFNGRYGIITINENIIGEGRKNFTIAHEFGHFCNEKSKMQFCREEDIQSINVDNGREINANLFASELLMPCEWLAEFVMGKKLSALLLTEIAEYFSVSLSAAAIKVAQLDLYPCAFVMCTNSKVKWNTCSKSFKYKFIPAKKNVSSLSYVNDFLEGKNVNPSEEKIFSSAWFDEDSTFQDKNEMINEIIIPFRNFNSAIAILY